MNTFLYIALYIKVKTLMKQIMKAKSSIVGPLATSLSKRYGTRKIAFIGGCMVFVGCMLSSNTPNTEFMFLSFSLLAGKQLLCHRFHAFKVLFFDRS